MGNFHGFLHGVGKFNAPILLVSTSTNIVLSFKIIDVLPVIVGRSCSYNKRKYNFPLDHVESPVVVGVNFYSCGDAHE